LTLGPALAAPERWNRLPDPLTASGGTAPHTPHQPLFLLRPAARPFTGRSRLGDWNALSGPAGVRAAHPSPVIYALAWCPPASAFLQQGVPVTKPGLRAKPVFEAYVERSWLPCLYSPATIPTICWRYARYTWLDRSDSAAAAVPEQEQAKTSAGH